MVINITGGTGGTLTVPDSKAKLYIVFNNASDAVTVKTVSGTGISVPKNTKAILYSNGTDVVDVANYFSSLSLGSALPVASGGTGFTAQHTPVSAGVLVGDGAGGFSNTLVAPGTSGNLLTSNGTTWTSAAAPTSFVSGMLMPYAGTTAPSGWLLCYGQAVSRTTYASLFSAISITYGSGDGTTTFNLPDFRGRIAAGQDNMGGSAASRLTTAVSGVDGTTVGASGGDQRQQSHTHTATVTDPGHNHTFASVGAAGGAGNIQSGGGTVTTPPTSTSTTGISVANSTTGAGSSQNVQPTLVVTYIIKT
jgi:microcystin-dependent protein